MYKISIFLWYLAIALERIRDHTWDKNGETEKLNYEFWKNTGLQI